MTDADEGRVDGTPGRAIVGRTTELERADAFLDATATRFAVLGVHGPAGIGKSTIWHEIARRARTRGYAFLSSRPSEGEARISLASVGDLLERIPADVIAALPEPQRRAAEVVLLREPPAGPPIPERVLATAIRTALARMSMDSPVVVALDDVQWLDASSAAVLSFVARRLDLERVGLLVAHRSGTADPVGTGGLDARFRESIEVGPMPVGTLHHVIREQLGSTLSRSVLVRVHEASGGNPLFALEIARILKTTGIPSPGRGLPVPDDVRTAVATRVGALPATARETLLAAAAAGTTSEADLKTVLGRPVADDLRLADAQGLVHGGDPRGAHITFVHPLFAAAVYGAASADDRRAAHRAIAVRTTDPEERARHLALSAVGSDAETAAALEAAGTSAVARGATVSAAELFELAWEATPPPDLVDALRRRISHASALHDAGDTTRAWSILAEVADAAPPGTLRARARLEQVRLAQAVATEEDIARLGDAALVDAQGDLALVAEIRGVLSRLVPNQEESRAHAQAALDILDALADPDPHSESHAIAALCGWEILTRPDGRPRAELVERALELEARAPLPRVGDRFSASLGVWLKYADDFDGARTWLDLTLRSAIDEGDDGTLPYVYSHLPQLDLWTGDWARAEEMARRHFELAEATGQESQRRQALYNLGLVYAHQGREDESRTVLGDALQAAARDGDIWTEAICLAPLGLLELSLGNNGTALTALERVSEIWREFGDDSPRRHEPDLVEALVAAGESDRAGALADDLARRSADRGRHSMQAAAARAQGLVAGAAGDGEAAFAAFGRALEHHAAVDIPFDRARTLLAIGAVRRRRRERGLARDALAEAADILGRLGSRLWAERARSELSRLGLRRSSGDELTEAERRVAELAAAGRTSREIAATLFMSPKTVEANLGRVYRKLGIGSRAELGAWLAGRQT